MDLKIKDVAELLKVSETTIRRWLTDGKIPAYRIQHQYRFSRMEIENWMLACKLKAPQEIKGASPTQIYPLPNEQEEQTLRGGMKQYCLYRALNQGDVFYDLNASSKEELIRVATKSIAPKLNVDAEVLAELLLDREKLMPTALNNGVAVPHTRDFLRNGPLDMVFIVFPRTPLEYGALDGKPVNVLFFLFASNDKGHLQLLAKLAHLSSSEQALSFLSKKPDKKQLLDFMRNWEGQAR